MIANKKNIADREEFEKLLNILVHAFFQKLNNLNQTGIMEINDYFAKAVENDRNTGHISEKLYEKMKNAVNVFKNLMYNSQVVEELKSKKISKKEFLDMYRTTLEGTDREKYEMSDLYNSGLIATDKRNGMRKRATIVRTDKPKEHIFTDRNNRTVIITDLGQLVYETCLGAGQYIMMYRVQKEEEPGSGKYSSNIVYTNISMPNMSDPNYKNLVLDELLSYDNISGAKCGGYIGEIVLQPAKSETDLPHLERQGSYGYVYRLNSKYILHYDPTDVSASMNMPAMELHGKKQDNGRDNNNGGGPRYSKKDAEYER